MGPSDDPWGNYWTIITLLLAHYVGNFDEVALRFAAKVREWGDHYRAAWIKEMVKTGKPPTREWEDSHIVQRLGLGRNI